MAITGAHLLLYSPEPDALRSVLTDVFAWPSVDAGGGWMIFALPPTETAIHPADEPRQELTLKCDDIAATAAELRERGVVFDGEAIEDTWGIHRTMVLPGDVRMLLYEPRHVTPLDLDA